MVRVTTGLGTIAFTTTSFYYFSTTSNTSLTISNHDK